MSRVSGLSGDFPVQLAMRLTDWSAGSLLRVVLCCPFVGVVLQIPRARHSTTCCGHLREEVTRILRERYEETAAVKFKLQTERTSTNMFFSADDISVE